MSKKYKVTLEAEEGQEITIKPIGETLTSRVSAGDSNDSTTTSTATNSPRGVDVGADVDGDM
jgi:hypothetical protein